MGTSDLVRVQVESLARLRCLVNWRKKFPRPLWIPARHEFGEASMPGTDRASENRSESDIDDEYEYTEAECYELESASAFHSDAGSGAPLSCS